MLVVKGVPVKEIYPLYAKGNTARHIITKSSKYFKILSLDGITDGKIAPYLSNRDINGFLHKYRPKYWIANQATSLPFFSDSILGEVVEKTGNKEGSEITIDGIHFKNIQTRKEPINVEFWGYTQIYELSYD